MKQEQKQKAASVFSPRKRLCQQPLYVARSKHGGSHRLLMALLHRKVHSSLLQGGRRRRWDRNNRRKEVHSRRQGDTVAWLLSQIIIITIKVIIVPHIKSCKNKQMKPFKSKWTGEWVGQSIRSIASSRNCWHTPDVPQRDAMHQQMVTTGLRSSSQYRTGVRVSPKVPSPLLSQRGWGVLYGHLQ